MAECALNDCRHTTYRSREACKRKLRAERLADLDQKEMLIRAERIAILVDIERDRDLPMPGEEPGSDLCPACRALRRG